MSKLRTLEPAFSDSFETALRRFFTPIAFEAEPVNLKMQVDLSENDNAYQVKADIPGVKKEDINVHVDGNTVQIDAEINRKKETKGNGERLLCSERHWGSISRTFTLAHDIDDTKVQARYADGVLTLELPKKNSSASKKVTVQ
jgi:HSP20 family protein